MSDESSSHDHHDSDDDDDDAMLLWCLSVATAGRDDDDDFITLYITQQFTQLKSSLLMSLNLTDTQVTSTAVQHHLSQKQKITARNM